MGLKRITDQSLKVGDTGFVYSTGRWGDKPLTADVVPATVVASARKYATIELDGQADAYNGTFKVARDDGYAMGRDYRRFVTTEEAEKDARFRAAVRVMEAFGLGQASIGGQVELTLEQAEGIAKALQA
jgi:hypothetical protein